MTAGELVPRVRRLATTGSMPTSEATTLLVPSRPRPRRAWAMPTQAVVGLVCVVLAAAACTGTRDPATRGPANDANIHSLLGTWRYVNRDGTLSYRDHYRLEMKVETQELSLIWVADADDETYGKFLKGDERELGRFKPLIERQVADILEPLAEGRPYDIAVAASAFPMAFTTDWSVVRCQLSVVR